jgi:hypothetical protein
MQQKLSGMIGVQSSMNYQGKSIYLDQMIIKGRYGNPFLSILSKIAHHNFRETIFFINEKN